MNRHEPNANELTHTLAGLTRLLLVLCLAPGVLAGAVVAGALALLVWPVLAIGGSGRHPGRWLV